MASRKKKPRKASGARAAIARIEAELPKTLRGYVRDVETRLSHLERYIEKAGAAGRKEATRLLREASKQIGALEARGETAWRRLRAPTRKYALALLTRLEAAIAPTSKARSRRPRRKKKVGVKPRPEPV